MQTSEHGLIGTLLQLPIFQAEWVLWLLLLLSFVSVVVMVERYFFYRRHKIDIDILRQDFAGLLDTGDFAAAAKLLAEHDSLETNVVLFGLRDFAKGPDAVEDLISGATRKEKARYEKHLNFLATANPAFNAKIFIGLFHILFNHLCS